MQWHEEIDTHSVTMGCSKGSASQIFFCRGPVTLSAEAARLFVNLGLIVKILKWMEA